MLDKLGFSDEFEGKYFYICRTGDEGSLVTLDKLALLEEEFKEVDFNYSGAGYLFDMLGNDLTKQLDIWFTYRYFVNRFSILFLNAYWNYFIIIVPNITPIVVCIGLLFYINGFYFSLSNAFIFTIVFGHYSRFYSPY